MNKKKVNDISRVEIVQRYKDAGIEGLTLKDVNDFECIYGIAVDEITGFETLSLEHKWNFSRAIVSIYNRIGIENREKIMPRSIYYVEEVMYNYINSSDDELLCAYAKIYALNEVGTRICELIGYDFELDVEIKDCDTFVTRYLRFETNEEIYEIDRDNEFLSITGGGKTWRI